MNGQPLRSMADVQWILHHVHAEGGEVALRVRRDGEVITALLELGSGWRQADDISWRVSSWGMRGIATGGLSLKTLADDEKQALGIEGAMALRITHVGQYNKHATAKRAGFQVDDILISYDGRTDLRREADVFAYVGRNLKHGDVVDVEILRSGKHHQLTLPIQE